MENEDNIGRIGIYGKPKPVAGRIGIYGKLRTIAERIGIYGRILNKVGNYSFHRRFLKQSQQLMGQDGKFQLFKIQIRLAKDRRTKYRSHGLKSPRLKGFGASLGILLFTLQSFYPNETDDKVKFCGNNTCGGGSEEGILPPPPLSLSCNLLHLTYTVHTFQSKHLKRKV